MISKREAIIHLLTMMYRHKLLSAAHHHHLNLLLDLWCAGNPLFFIVWYNPLESITVISMNGRQLQSHNKKIYTALLRVHNFRKKLWNSIFKIRANFKFCQKRAKFNVFDWFTILMKENYYRKIWFYFQNSRQFKTFPEARQIQNIVWNKYIYYYKMKENWAIFVRERGTSGSRIACIRAAHSVHWGTLESSSSRGVDE